MTHFLHLIKDDLSQSLKINLNNLAATYLIALDDSHIAVLGHYGGCDDKEYSKIGIKIYDATGKQIKKIMIDKDPDKDYIAPSPDSQLITCSHTGEIVIHNVLPKKEELRKETETVLIEKLPKVLIPFVTDYAGLKNPRGFPEEKFEENNYPDSNTSK